MRSTGWCCGSTNASAGPYSQPGHQPADSSRRRRRRRVKDRKSAVGVGLVGEPNSPSRLPPRANSPRNSRSSDTSAAPASILATRDWLDFNFLATCPGVRCCCSRRARTARLNGAPQVDELTLRAGELREILGVLQAELDPLQYPSYVLAHCPSPFRVFRAVLPQRSSRFWRSSMSAPSMSPNSDGDRPSVTAASPLVQLAGAGRLPLCGSSAAMGRSPSRRSIDRSWTRLEALPERPS